MNSSMSTGLESLLNHVHLLLVIFSRVGLQGISRRAKLFTILTVKSRSRQMLGFNMILTSCVVFRYIITVSASETSIRSTDHLLLYCTIKGCKCITICYQSSVVLKDSINFIKIKDMIQKYSCWLLTSLCFLNSCIFKAFLVLHTAPQTPQVTPSVDICLDSTWFFTFVFLFEESSQCAQWYMPVLSSL